MNGTVGRRVHYLDIGAAEWPRFIDERLARRSDERRAAGDGGGQEEADMPADIVYERCDAALHIRIAGPLDLRCAFRLLAIAEAVDDGVTSCRLNLSGVTRVFDSGLAALMLLFRALAEKRVERIRVEDLDLNPAATFADP